MLRLKDLVDADYNKASMSESGTYNIGHQPPWLAVVDSTTKECVIDEKLVKFHKSLVVFCHHGPDPLFISSSTYHCLLLTSYHLMLA